MKHLEELADTFGFSIVIEDNGTRFGLNAKREPYLIAPGGMTPGFRVEMKPVIETAYHELHNALSIIAGTLVGDLGFLAYNSTHEGKECIEVVLINKTKLPFKIKNHFEDRAGEAISFLAGNFDSGLLCLVRRMAGSKTYSLIDDRRELKGKIDDPVLDGGGTAPNQEDARASPDELSPEHSAP